MKPALRVIAMRKTRLAVGELVARVIMGCWSKMERFLFFPQIQGGPQIIFNFNLLASLNLWEIKMQ
jgi:hypothetical protein